jgi:hypothetical protein
MFKSSCKCPGILLFLALSLFPAALFAQEPPREGRVFHIQGPDFSISTGNRRDPYTQENLGEIRGLVQGDLLQTGAATWVEFQLVPEGTVIKAAENTTLTYNGYDEQGKFFDIGLLYGRIRVVNGSGTLVVRSGMAAVSIGEGDLGVDYMVEPLAQGKSGTPKPRLRLYAFRGGGALSPFNPSGGALSNPPIMVRGGEYLFLEVQTPLVLTERGPLEEGIFRYWVDHHFEGKGPAVMPETTLALPASGEAEKTEENLADIAAAAKAETETGMDLSFPLPDTYSRAKRIKNITLGLGIFLTAAGAAMQGFSHYYSSGNTGGFAGNLHTIGYGPLGMGLVTLLAGMLYNPPSP